MVTFNTNDFNIDKVETLARINKFKTAYDYRVYGLREDDDNPIVLIEYNPELFIGEIGNFHKNALINFFRGNGVELRFRDEEKEDSQKFWIGLRYDLRKDITISANIVQTVVYFLEGKLDLNIQYKIPGIPKLYRWGKK